MIVHAQIVSAWILIVTLRAGHAARRNVLFRNNALALAVDAVLFCARNSIVAVPRIDAAILHYWGTFVVDALHPFAGSIGPDRTAVPLVDTTANDFLEETDVVNAGPRGAIRRRVTVAIGPATVRSAGCLVLTYSLLQAGARHAYAVAPGAEIDQRLGGVAVILLQRIRTLVVHAPMDVSRQLRVDAVALSAVGILIAAGESLLGSVNTLVASAARVRSAGIVQETIGVIRAAIVDWLVVACPVGT